ncbi:MAG: hypothetical protein JKY45_04155 [Emcibacter sp.]|nr:hypothetical protein [Emcibacter sp.]
MPETISPETMDHWKSWIGKTETRTETLCPEILRRFAAATDADLNVQENLPPLAHWAFFLPIAPSDKIGEDGHPLRGGFVPPVTLAQRMFASANITLLAPLQLGLKATMHSEITDIKYRSGKSGELVFMEVMRTISQKNKSCITEQQTIVFKHGGDVIPPVEVISQPTGINDELWTPGPVELFRFSAVTFNSHRIHYDVPYATGEEGYPGLVVHGPFTAIKLYGHAEKHLDAPLKSFRFRASAPLFVGQEIILTAGKDDGEYSALRCDGTRAMTATATV